MCFSCREFYREQLQWEHMQRDEPAAAADQQSTANTSDPSEGLPARRVKLTWAAQIEPEPVVWAWEDQGEGRIPAGSLSMAAGREGTGKSSFGIWLAAQITNGQLPGSWFGQRRAVFYLAVEDSWRHTLVPRLLAAGADLTRVARFEVVNELDAEVTLSLPYDNALLERSIIEYAAALVVVDPLMSVIGERIDTHRSREVRTALDPIAKMADRTGAVILGIAHFNKGSGSDVSALITGSGAFKDVPRSIFGFACDEFDENNGRVMTQSKNSLGRNDLPSLGYRIESAEIPTSKGAAKTGRFVFTGESDRTVSDILRDAARGAADDHGDQNPAQRFILRYIAQHADENGEVLARDVIAAGDSAGYTDKDLTKARVRCKAPKISSRREGFGKNSRVLWSIDSPIGSIDSKNQCVEPMESIPESIAGGGGSGSHAGDYPTGVRTHGRRVGQWLASGDPVATVTPLSADSVTVERARRKILDLLSSGGEMTARQMRGERISANTRSGVDPALDLLVASGEIISRQDGQKTVYRLAESNGRGESA